MQSQACEHGCCLSILPLEYQDRVQLEGRVEMLFLKKGGWHIAWPTRRNLGRK